MIAPIFSRWLATFNKAASFWLLSTDPNKVYYLNLFQPLSYTAAEQRWLRGLALMTLSMSSEVPGFDPRHLQTAFVRNPCTTQTLTSSTH